MTHFIQQQHLHVSLSGTEEEGLALQNRLPGFCNDWLQAAIGQVLDRCAPAKGRLYIEHLEIDVGTIPLDRLEQELAGAVAAALEAAIREKAVPAASDVPVDKASVQIKTNSQTNWDAFLYFLDTGRLPWSFRLPAGETLEMLLSKTWEDTPNLVFSLPQIKKALAGQTARQRLVAQFSVSFVEKIVASLAPELLLMMQRILSISSDYAPVKSFEKQLWGSALAQIARGDIIREAALLAGAVKLAQPLPPERKAALRNILERLSPDLEDVSEEDLAELRELRVITEDDASGLTRRESEIIRSENAKQAFAGESGVIEAAKPALVKDHPALTDPERTLKPKQVPAKDSPLRNDAEDASKLIQGLAEVDPMSSALSAGEGIIPKAALPGNAKSETQFKSTSAIQVGEAIYVDNAGLVLLHPFLSQFFEALGITFDGEMQMPQRALALLHFLATGQNAASEYELALPKVLCALLPDDVVEGATELSKEEIEESINLLETVVRYWDVLRDTSPDGLRGTFLCRPGKLSRRENDWLLQVERQSHDILLENLPWGIAMLQLPWMPQMLIVEWN